MTDIADKLRAIKAAYYAWENATESDKTVKMNHLRFAMARLPDPDAVGSLELALKKIVHLGEQHVDEATMRRIRDFREAIAVAVAALAKLEEKSHGLMSPGAQEVFAKWDQQLKDAADAKLEGK